MTYRMTLIAGAIVALAGMPAWAQSTGSTTGTAAPAGAASQTGQSTPGGTSDSRSTTGQSSAPGAGQSDRGQGASSMTPGAQMGGASTTSQSASASQQASSNPIYRQSADHLNGMDVVDLNGEEIGTVDRVVLAPDRKKAHVVISYGGLLGMGEKHKLVSMDDLQLVDGNLKMRQSKQNFEAMADYQSTDQYTELRGDDPIQGSLVEFSAFEPEKDAATRGATPGTSAPGQSRTAPR